MKKILLSVLVGCLLGAGVTHLIWEARSERELASLALLNELSRAGSATRHLELLEQERYSTARKVQRMNLDFAVDNAYRLIVDYQPMFDIHPAPNMILEIERSRAYLARVSPESRSRLWLDKVVDYVEAESPIAASVGRRNTPG